MIVYGLWTFIDLLREDYQWDYKSYTESQLVTAGNYIKPHVNDVLIEAMAITDQNESRQPLTFDLDGQKKNIGQFQFQQVVGSTRSVAPTRKCLADNDEHDQQFDRWNVFIKDQFDSYYASTESNRDMKIVTHAENMVKQKLKNSRCLDRDNVDAFKYISNYCNS